MHPTSFIEFLVEAEIGEWEKQGYNSFFKKLLSQDNPYSLGSKAGRAWFKGWKRARTNADNYKWQSPDAVSISVDPVKSTGHS